MEYKLQITFSDLTTKSISISKEAMRYFTGCGTQLGNRISALADLLQSKEEPPRVWCNQSLPTTPRLFEMMRFGVLEVQEHLETFFDRKDHGLEILLVFLITYCQATIERDPSAKPHRLFWRVPSDYQSDDFEFDDLSKSVYDKPPSFAPYERLPQPLNDPYNEDYDSEKEFESDAPYGIQNVQRNVQMPSALTRSVEPRVTFQSLCSSRRQHVYLNIDSKYVYRPDHYEEVTCAYPYTNHKDYELQNNKVCGNFSCIQINRTIFLTRKAYGSNCWESETRLIPAGCECMWPKHVFGDIVRHH